MVYGGVGGGGEGRRIDGHVHGCVKARWCVGDLNRQDGGDVEVAGAVRMLGDAVSTAGALWLVHCRSRWLVGCSIVVSSDILPQDSKSSKGQPRGNSAPCERVCRGTDTAIAAN